MSIAYTANEKNAALRTANIDYVRPTTELNSKFNEFISCKVSLGYGCIF